jgi:hypothetical protein
MHARLAWGNLDLGLAVRALDWHVGLFFLANVEHLGGAVTKIDVLRGVEVGRHALAALLDVVGKHFLG